MSTVNQLDEVEAAEDVAADPFDLDIRVVEVGDAAEMLIEVTDDGCKPTCPESCNSAV